MSEKIFSYLNNGFNYEARDKANFIQYRYLPVQFIPSPWNPSLHVQL